MLNNQVQLFASEFSLNEAKPQVQSMQSKVYFGRDKDTENEVVIK